MSSFVPYSEKQKILTPAQWEGLRCLDQDCKTVKVAAEIMRAIVKRLLKIDKTGIVNINDFEFLVFDDEHPNAGFIADYHTTNHKNVIVISSGITKLCKTEAQFAGVLAHELGHYIYKKLYGKTENTIFQERFADLHALDLMIAGGYDPVAYSEVCEEMRESHSGDALFDVHGSGMARKEDVDAYLTKLREESGDFKPTTPTGLYNNFAKVMNSQQDGYMPYFTGLIAKNFPKTLVYIDSVYLPPIKQVLDLILSEIKNGRLNSRERVEDMLSYIYNYKRKTKHEIQSTQNFLEQLIDLYQKDPMLQEHLAHYMINNLAKELKSKFRGDKPFNVFGPVAQDVERIKDFMTSRDPVHVRELAWDFYHNDSRIFRVIDIRELFDEPEKFKMPLRAMAKGTVMPTHWLWTQFYRTNDWFYINQTIEAVGVDCKYKWLTDEQLRSGMAANYGGKIIAINEKEINKIRAQHERQFNYENAHSHFKDFMFAINALYDFERGKISANDMVSKCRQYAGNENYNKTMIVKWLHQRIKLEDYKHENTFLKSELQELNNSEAFAELYIKPFLEMLKQAMGELFPIFAKLIRVDTPPRGKTWFEYLQIILLNGLRLKEDATLYVNHNVQLNGRLLDSIKNIARKLGLQDTDYEVWNVRSGPIIEHMSQIHTEKLQSVFSKFVEAAVNGGGYSAQNAADILFEQIKDQESSSYWTNAANNKVIAKLTGIEKRTLRKLQKDTIEQYSIYASSTQWVMHNYATILAELEKDVDQRKDLHKIHRLLTTFGFVAKNEQELIDIFSKPTPQVKTETYYVLESMLKEFTLTYYMRNNPPIKNLYSVLFATRNDEIAKFRSTFANELGLYIDKHNLIPTNFQSLYDLHAIMEYLDVFSREKPDQSRMLGMLVAELEKMPRGEREEYSWKLLSGFYYADDDERVKLNRNDKNMDFPLIKKRLLDIYTSAVAERLGHDDDSEEYFAKIQEFAKFINQKHYYDVWRDVRGNIIHGFDRQGLNKVTQGNLYRLITDKIQSQERVSQFLSNDKNVVLSDAKAQDNELLGRVFESLLDDLCRHRELALYTIEFLNEKLTQKSILDYCNKCMGSEYSGNIAAKLTASNVENWYHMFWASGLKVRAIIMGKLLNRAFNTLDKKIKYVCDMNFDKKDKYRADAEMICDCVIKSFEPYEQNLILAAIASADENKQEGKQAARSVGDGLRMFFETMGPAWVKFGQLLSYVPDLPSEIRRDLGKLKDRADMPARWDVYEWMHQAMPEEVYNRIERVEDIVGAGSFWMTAVVQFKNGEGQSEKKVVQLLRPHADGRAEAGFKTIEEAIKKLSKQKQSYKILRNVAQQAHESAKYEVDVGVGAKQYTKAKELYGDIHVSIDGKIYTPHVADWCNYGVGKDGMAYKIMDFAQGDTLARVKVSDDERRKMALAYFTIEMVVLFKGDVWDIDRHQGQQNFDITSPNDVNINIYDTGAQLPKAPSNKDKALLANIFFGLTKAVQSGESLESYLLKTIKRLDKLHNTLNVDVSYVSNVEKGLMAISDIIEYQKEIKDEDGNIIQERKTLSDKDLKHAIMAVLQNPSIDKYLSTVIKGRAVINKLSRFELKALKDLARSSGFGNDNPVKISIMGVKENSSNVEQLNKAIEEIEKLNASEDQVLGIPMKHIKPKNQSQNLTLDPQLRKMA